MFESSSGFKFQLRRRGVRVGAAAVVAGLLAVGLVLVPGVATGQGSTPAQPTGLTATPTSSSVTVSWTPGTATSCPHSRYEVKIELRGSASAIGGVQTVTPPGPYTATVTGLTSGTNYRVKLDVVGTCGRWASSVYKLFTTTGTAPSSTTSTTQDDSLPAQPTGLTAKYTSSSVTVSWTPGTATSCPHSRYQVEVHLQDTTIPIRGGRADGFTAGSLYCYGYWFDV